MKTRRIFLTVGAIALLASCQETTKSDTIAAAETPEVVETVKDKKGLVKVTILYPNGEGKTFDMDYYSNKHMPMVAELLGESLKFLEIDKGMAGRTPDELIPYLAIGYLYFDKLADYQSSFGPNAEKILTDIPNYTNIQPILQISEVLQ